MRVIRSRAFASLLLFVALANPTWGQDLDAPPAGATPPVAHAESDFAFVSADQESLDSLRAEGRLRQDRRPTGLGAYSSFLLGRIRAKIYRSLLSALASITSVESVLKWAGRIFVGVVALLALFALATYLARLFGGQPTAPDEERLSSEEIAARLGRGAADWLAELERRLAAGDMAGALEAAWWWLARSLAAERVDPAWTSRELLDRARLGRSRRQRLLPAVRQLDTLAYGPKAPRPSEIRAFVDHLAAQLGAPPASGSQG